MNKNGCIDIKENDLLKIDSKLLEILLKDKTSGNNILWATDNYVKYGAAYKPKQEIKIDLITGYHGSIIKNKLPVQCSILSNGHKEIDFIESTVREIQI